ncbi:hypothetical protein BDR07DRAFT_1074789 [Suillus spraguei]|nr:hypothetical protein BDR07DRAFT_1074789 [Suillus spraguei]
MHLYAVVAANSILVYDHIVTLQKEITFIWRRPKALSATLFLLNRYVALLGNVISLCIAFLPISDELCEIHVIQTIALSFANNHHLPRARNARLCPLRL